MTDGVTTINVDPVAVADQVLVNRSGSTGLQTINDLGTQLAASGAIADAITATKALAASGVQWKDPAVVATTANINLATGLVNGAVIDGVAVATGDRVLVRSQATLSENGLYVVAASGAAARAADADASDELLRMAVFVRSGTLAGGKQFVCISAGTIVVGTTFLRFSEIADQSQLNANLTTLQTSVAQHSALENLIENGNLSDNARGVKLFDPDLQTGTSWTARFGGLPISDYLKSVNCDNALYVPASLGGRGNLVVQETTLVGGYMFVSMLVRSTGDWTFGNESGLVSQARYSDMTTTVITSAGGGLTYEIVSSTVRRYSGVIALDGTKTCVRVEMGLNDGGARTANFYLTGFWASWAHTTVSRNQTAYPNWRSSVANIVSLRGQVDRLSAFERRMKLMSLAERCSDGLVSIIIALLGDSNTWGLGATGIGESYPRNHALADPRDVLTSSSWPNLFGEWIGQLVCGGENLSNPSPGVRQYQQSQLVDPVTHDSVVLYNSSGQPINKVGTVTTGGKLYQYLGIPLGGSLEFPVYGQTLSLWFSALPNDAAQTLDVYVNGVLHGSMSAYASPAAFSKNYDIDFGSVVSKTVKLVNNSATTSLRLEAIEHKRICRVVNNGIIGTSSNTWLPAGALLSGGLPIEANFAMIMLGTNDRGDTTFPRDAVRLERNLSSILDWISANRPFTKPLLMTSVRAVGNYEEPDNPGTYFFSSSEVALANARVAASRKLPLIDIYGAINRIIVNGDDPLADDLHYNDIGHKAVFEVISKFMF
ncbi:MAG: SGNH/GDSL hydrolase family protein [Rhizobium sp.]|nr:MAG: SGNH/GDSL hydrolase family protein [Rhizobium sp.]